MRDSNATTRPDSTLDATGLLCPLPVLKARRALKAVPAGGILEVLATTPEMTQAEIASDLATLEALWREKFDPALLY